MTTVSKIAIILFMAALSSSAWTGESGNPNANPPPPQPQPAAQKPTPPAAPKALKINGKIVSVTTVKPKGEPENHILLKIRQESGREVLVDAGKISELGKRDINLNGGDRFEIAGRPGKLDGKQVFVAEQIASAEPRKGEERRFEANYSDNRGRGFDMQMRDRGGDWRNVRHILAGKVLDARLVKMREDNDQHVVVALRTFRGRDIEIDLGPQSNLQDVNVDNGDKIVVSGTFGRLDGHPILVARSVAEIVSIPRSSGEFQSSMGQEHSVSSSACNDESDENVNTDSEETDDVR